MNNKINIKTLKDLLQEIRKKDDFEVLKISCRELYNLIQTSTYKDIYTKKVTSSWKYSNTEEYKTQVCELLQELDKILCEYEGYCNNNIYDETYFPINKNAINFLYENIDNSNGLIKAYLSIFYIDKCDDYKYIDFYCPYKNTLDKHIYDIDYIIFDIFYNSNYVDMFGQYIENQDQILCSDDLTTNPNSLNLLKIISTKIISDIEKYTSILDEPQPLNTFQKESLLNNTEIEILKIRKDYKSTTINATHEFIGSKLNPKLSKSNVSQKVMSIKNKLGASSIDDAIRILEQDYGYIL